MPVMPLQEGMVNPCDASVNSKRDRILWIGIRSPQVGSELMSQ